MLKETLCADEWRAVQEELPEEGDTAEVCTRLHLKISGALATGHYEDTDPVSILLTPEEADEVAAIFSNRGWL